MTDIETWYKTLPAFTRYYLTSAVLTTALCSFNFLSFHSLYFDFSLIFKQFQLWRLLTSFIYFGNFSFNFLIGMVILVTWCRPLETHQSFEGKFPDFIWAIVLMALVLMGASYFAGFYFLGNPLVFAIMYVWSRKDPDRLVSFWGGFTFKSTFHSGYQLPFVLMAVHILMGGSIMEDLVGMLAGHIYYFLSDVVPEEYGYNLVKAPWLLVRLFSFKQRVEYQAFSGQGLRAN